MVRVNLLPEKRQSKARVPASEPGQLWILVVLGVLVLEVVALLFVEKFKQDQLAQITNENNKVLAQVATIQGKIKDHNEIKAQLKDLKEREEAIAKLQAGRTGPTAVLMELSKVLTPGREPTGPHEKFEQLRAEHSKAAFSLTWDTRRLWLTSYQELERAVKLAGLARDAEDVSEFQRRLVQSDYFYEVNLLPGGKVQDQATKQELVRFELSAKVRY